MATKYLRLLFLSIMSLLIASCPLTMELEQPLVSPSAPIAVQDSGHFTVGENGDARYAIPIVVPPGIGNTAPNLSLVYSSQNGDDRLGVGWRLQGLSAITRCSAIPATDGFRWAVDYGARDRYCLDGQRLINVQGEYASSSSVYRTELETWRLVTASPQLCGAGPCSFTVVDSSGAKSYYGTTDDSRILAVKGDHVRVWAIAHYEDLNGNAVDFSYTNTPDLSDGDLAHFSTSAEDGQFYPQSIAYTSNQSAGLKANRFIRFDYESRPQLIATYIGGSRVYTKARLKNIQTYVGETLVKEYRLGYMPDAATGRSLLETITECAGQEPDAPCLPPTQIAWQTQEQVLFRQQDLIEKTSVPTYMLPMDIDGDGRGDLVSVTVVRGSNSWLINEFISTGNSLKGCDESRPIPTSGSDDQLLNGDVNGDGRSDLIHIYGSLGELYYDTYIASADGCSFGEGPSNGLDEPSSPQYLWPMDANGDGRVDLVGTWLIRGNQYALTTFLGSDVGFIDSESITITLQIDDHFSPADVNGDGMVDLIQVASRQVTTFISNGESFEPGIPTDINSSSVNLIDLLPLDINGDGKTDLVQGWKNEGALQLSTFLADGAGHFVCEQPDPDEGGYRHECTSSGQGWNNVEAFWPMDADGDHRIDLVQAWQHEGIVELIIYQNTNTGLNQGVETDTNIADSNDDDLWPMDLNGDGKTDLIQGIRDGGSYQLVGYLSQGAIPDLVASVVNPIGGKVEITYLPMSNPEVYTAADEPIDHNSTTATQGVEALSYPYRQAPAQAPFQSVGGGALQLVHQVVRSNVPEINSSTYRYTDTYTYAGGRADFVSGRGWAGFRQTTKLDEQTGRRMVTIFNQGFPLTGTTAKIIYECDGHVQTAFTDPSCPVDKSDTRLTASVTEYQPTIVISNSAGQQIWEVLQAQTRFDTYDYGEYDYSRITKYAYDDYGNQILLSELGYSNQAGENLSNDDDVYTCASYSNTVTTDSWRLGYLLHSKVAATPQCSNFDTFDSATDFQLEHFTYTAQGELESHAIYDSANAVNLVTRYTYDDFGNQLTETTPGPGDRTTHFTYESTYHTYLARTQSPPNEQGIRLVQSFGYDPRFGIQVASISPNQHTTVQCLDPFGQLSAMQGPLPTEPANVMGQSNCVPTMVTGDAATFQNAPVVTLATYTPQQDSVHRIYLEARELQAWPLEDQTPVWRWSRAYYDGLGRSYLAMAEEEPGVGVSATCSNLNADDKGVRDSIPRYFESDTIACTSSDGDEDLLWATQQYDAYGRPMRHVQPIGADGQETSVTTVAFAKGINITITKAVDDPNSIQTVMEYTYVNAQRKLQRTIVPADGNATTTFSYDRVGRLLAVTDPATASNPNGVANTITYDSIGRRVSVNNPDQNTCGETDSVSCQSSQNALTLTYDPLTGLLATATDAKGQTTRFFYDVLGRMTRKVLPAGEGAGEIHYGYDDPNVTNGQGQRTQVEAVAEDGALLYRYTYAYDDYGNQMSTSLELDGAHYASGMRYDPLGRVIRYIYPDGFQVDQAYAMGNLATISVGATDYASFQAYTAVGGPQKIDYANQTHASYSYAPTGEPLHQRLVDSAGTTILDVSIEYNQLLQITGIVDHLQPEGVDYSQSFTYNLTRLTEAAAPGLYGEMQFAYDAAGNLMAKDGYTYTYTAHRISAGTGEHLPDFAAHYDLNGNLIEKQMGDDIWHYTYDVRNRLTQVNQNGESLLAVTLYNDAGSRLKKLTPDGIETIYVSSLYELSRFPDGSEQATKYIASPGGTVATITTVNEGAASADSMDGVPTPGTLYFHRDYLGSTSLTTGEDGRLQSRMVYLPYGGVFEPGSSGPDNFRPKLQGRELDEAAALYYFGARYYDPALGRFLTPDAQLGSHLYGIDSLNRLAFALNNPVTFIDPTGHSVLDVIAGELFSAVEIVAGIAVDIISEGALEPIGGALIGAGLNGVQYGFTHTNNFSWKQFAVQQGMGALLGLFTGGLGSMSEAGTAPLASETMEDIGASVARSEAGETLGDAEGIELTTFADREAGESLGEATSGGDAVGGENFTCAASFPAGVIVWGTEGQLPIEEIAVGEIVFARNAIDYANAPEVVVATRQGWSSDLVELEFSINDGRREQLVLTSNHAVWKDGQGWIPAEMLKIGDQTATISGTHVTVLSTRHFKINDPIAVYNFEVAEYHSYFVGTLGIWVHNPRCQTGHNGPRAMQPDEGEIYQQMENHARSILNNNFPGQRDSPAIAVIRDTQQKLVVHYSGGIDSKSQYVQNTFNNLINSDDDLVWNIWHSTEGGSYAGRSPFNCAEPKACFITQQPPTHIATFKIDNHNFHLMNPCANCSRWVYDMGYTVFRH